MAHATTRRGSSKAARRKGARRRRSIAPAKKPRRTSPQRPTAVDRSAKPFLSPGKPSFASTAACTQAMAQAYGPEYDKARAAAVAPFLLAWRSATFPIRLPPNLEGVRAWIVAKATALGDRAKGLTAYLELKVQDRDWHGVQDAASDLRDIAAAQEVLAELKQFCVADEARVPRSRSPRPGSPPAKRRSRRRR